MKKLLVTCVVMALVIVLGASHLMALNPRVANTASSKLHNYSFLAKKAFDESNPSALGKFQSTTSLGAFSVDGGSPGYIITRTYRDDQNHGNPGRFVDWRVNPQIHFIFANQVCGGHTNPDACARWIHYNMFDPTTSPNGVFIAGPTGIPLQANPLAEGGLYPNMDVDADGRIVTVGEALTAADAENAVRWVRMWWDLNPSSWGTFVGDSIPDQVVGTGSVNFHYPVTAYQEFNGMYITHVVALNGDGVAHADAKLITHWRKEVSTVTGIGSPWTSNLVVDGPWTDAYDIAVSRDGGGKAAIVWLRARNDAADWGSSINLITSDDAGLTWTSSVDIVPFTEGVPSWQPWQECNLVYDSDNFLHAVYNAQEYDGASATSIDPAKVLHWTNRVAGPDAGGTTSSVDLLDLHGLSDVDCAGSSNVLNNGKVSISECNGRLYSIWMSYGDATAPDDCAADSVSDGFRGAVNAEIFMNVSLSLDGSLWDFRRNLTNSHTPGCDGFTDNECDHDAFPSVSRHGMNTAAMGTTYWGAVPEAFEVRDALDNSYPVDGYYLDVQFTNDLVADVARYMDTQFWSNNPIKWFRLPCVPPVIEPRILIASNPLQHPSFWVKQGTDVSVDIDVENIGNDALEITSITAAYVQGAGWLQVNTPSLSLAPATADVVSLTLNPGGAITTTGTDAVAIEGYVVFTSNDPNNPVDSFYINTVVTDEVIQITYQTIHTGLGVPLILANNGTFGGVGTGGNLQFFEEGGIELDCDSQGVYLYDGSPVMMADAATGWWANYYSVDDPDPAVNFVPVPGGTLAETGSTPAYEQYTTGDFVTADSSIGMIRTWAAPSDSVAYMVEKWQIFSWNGADITGINLGEWVDMDVPSDTGANNVGSIVEADDYIFVTGQEGDGDGCLPSDARFFTTGLLGYYLQSAYNGDPGVNNTGLDGAFVGPTEDLMENQEFIADSIWAAFGAGTFTPNNTDIDDKRSLLDFGSFDILATDTLVIWIMHGSILNGTETDVATQVADAKVWYMANRDGIGTFGCCGAFTGGFPGNTNCDIEGKRNLADITKLIDHVYISKADLCCNENGNVNADIEGKRNLADITKLIDHVYISKAPTPLCL